MTPLRRWPIVLACLLACSSWAAQSAAVDLGAEDPPVAAPGPVHNSVLDDRLLYQLLIGEMALNQGDAGTAYDWILDAARRTHDEGLFRRATDIALQARAGEQALGATRAWRLAHPESLDALRLQLQILLLLNRSDGLAEPLRALLAMSPAADRPGIIVSMPRFLQRANDPPLVASLVDEVTRPYRDEAATRVPVRVALGRAWLNARNLDRALELAREAQGLDPSAPGAAMLALELMRERPAAEAIVQAYLQHASAEPAMRMAYVRALTGLQRFGEAVVQIETATRLQPGVAGPYLTLGALYLELKQNAQAETALQRYVELVQQAPAQPAPQGQPDNPHVSAASTMEAEDDEGSRPDQGLTQAWLMLAQSAEQRGDYKATNDWLARITDPQRALEVQSRRASMLARQGQVAQGRDLIRQVPERQADDARAKLGAEAALLREFRLWPEAYQVLAGAIERFPEDTELLYEQAMMAEKLNRLDDMERLLRRVIALKPDNAHAHNALGYSLADRRVRLPEARKLVQRALELSPGDPFITDSLGWVEFRMGNRDEAARLLRLAYNARPDTEIAAHLGEVLWTQGLLDEARRIWREGRQRDAGNDVLSETLARLRVEL